MEALKVLYLASDPAGQSRLRLDEEIRAITRKIRASDNRDSVQIVSAWATRPDDLLQCLQEFRPQIVHFSGHSTADGELLLTDDDGRPSPVSAGALRALFTTLKDNIRVVFLNACYSEKQAEAIISCIDFVIGMRSAISDEAATAFASAFYQALGFDRTIQDAFDLGRAALLLQGIPEQETPHLLIREGASADTRVADSSSSNFVADPASSSIAAKSSIGGAPEAGLPGVVVGQPPPLAPAYQRREAARALVDVAWAHRGAGPTCLLISGDSGVGKSQFAAGVFWDSTSAALRAWVPAASQETLLAAYAAIASVLGCAGTGDLAAQARALVQWLAGPAAGSWLLVLDDLGLDPKEMWGWWPPSTPRGRVVVTTTHRDAAFDGYGRSWIRLDVYTPAEAVSYLTDRLTPHLGVDIPGNALSEAEDLAKDLGFLPVALAQAAAAIIDAGSSCARYRQRFADRATSLSVLFPDGAAATPTDTVATTWSLSIERADKIRPIGLARPAAAVCAVTHPDGVPEDLWITPAVRAYLNRHRTPSTPAPALEGGADPVSIPDAEAALRALHLLSIVTITKGGAAAGVRIHGLAQRAIWDTITEVQRSETIRAAADGLAEIWPDVEKDIALATVLRSNATRLADLYLDTLWSPPHGHPVVSRLGKSLGEAGLTSQARDLFGRMASLAADRFGPDHAETLTTRGNFALWTGVAGAAAKAREIFAELLDDRLRLLGPEDPSTLTTRNDLAYWTGQAGDPVAAVKAFTELLPDRERLLGPDDPATLTTRNDLALWTGEAGDKAGARDQYARLLDDQLRLLGADDPATLSTRSHLALWTGEAGDAAGARDQFDRLLPDQKRVLGPDHPDTLTTRSDLALWTGEAGDAAGARDQFDRLLPDQMRALGPDHPRTLTTRFNLALWTGEAGDPAGARDQFAELLPDRTRVLGEDHADTLRTRCNLAHAQGMAGDVAEAATALATLLPDLAKVLGPDDTDTLKAQSSLDRWSAETGTGVPVAAPLGASAAPSTTPEPRPL